MFEKDPSADDKVNKVVRALGSHAATLSHSRHIHIDKPEISLSPSLAS
jgi:hypothetical protein